MGLGEPVKIRERSTDCKVHFKQSNTFTFGKMPGDNVTRQVQRPQTSVTEYEKRERKWINLLATQTKVEYDEYLDSHNIWTDSEFSRKIEYVAFGNIVERMKKTDL